MLIEIKHNATFYRVTPIYGPFLIESKRICFFECLNCGAGTHTCFNKEDNTIHRNSFELRPHEAQPHNLGDLIPFKACPDCGKKTLVKA